MGCSIPRSHPPVLLIPEEENCIYQNEIVHPFANTEANTLYTVVLPLSKAGTVEEDDTIEICEQLGVSLDSFTNPKSPYFAYWESLRVHGVISAKLLLTSAILLSKSIWQTKMKMLLCIYESNSCTITKSDLDLMVTEMIYVALNVTPSVNPDTNKKHMYYLKSLNNSKANLVQNFLAFLGNKESYSSKYIIARLFKHDLYQKLLWCSGIRIILIEENLAIMNGHTAEQPESSAASKESSERSISERNNIN